MRIYHLIITRCSTCERTMMSKQISNEVTNKNIKDKNAGYMTKMTRNIKCVIAITPTERVSSSFAELINDDRNTRPMQIVISPRPLVCSRFADRID